MRILRNERHIRIRTPIGRYMPWSGILILLVGWIISLGKLEQPDQVTVPLISIPLGFTLAIVGGYFFERYAGPFAHHAALLRALKGLDDRYVLVQYLLPASHVLLEPGGLIVFVIKTQGGQVTFQERGRWKHQQRGKFFRQFAGQEAVGAPDLEAEIQMEKLKRWLAKRLPEVEIPIRSLILFVNPEIEVEADDSPIPVLKSDKLKAWLRGAGKLRPLPPETYQRLAEALGVADAPKA